MSNHRHRIATLALALSTFFAPRAYADAPLAPPVRHEVCSPDNKVCADLDPKRDTSTVFRKLANGKRQVLWTLPSFVRWGELSNDGHMLFVDFGGIPRSEKPLDEPIGILYRDGVLVRRFYVRDFVKDVTELQATVSHYVWGEVHGFDPAGLLHITTHGGHDFAIETGGNVVAVPRTP